MLRNSALSITFTFAPHALVPDAAEFLARHQMLARLRRSARAAPRCSPGTSMVLMLVPSIRNPWTTSALVARNVIGVSVGTTMHCGVKEYCWPIARTVTEPSGSTALPRLLSTNSPPRCSVAGIGGLDLALRHGRLMDAGERRHAATRTHDDHDRQRRPAPLDARRDRFAPWTAGDPATLVSVMRHSAAERRRRDKRQTRSRPRSAVAMPATTIAPARARAHDASTRLVLGAGRGRLRRGGIDHGALNSSGAERSSLACTRRRPAAAIAPGGADIGDDGGDLVVGQDCAKGGMP